MSFIDVGANWGVHSLYLSKLVGPSGLVLAFEPFPEAMCTLKWHISANNCSNVITVDKAASERDGHALFAMGQSASTGGLAETAIGLEQASQFRIETTRLDSVIDD